MPQCINCNSDDLSDYFTAYDLFEQKHDYLKCNACDLVFMHPFPSNQIQEKAYNSEYYGTDEEEKFESKFIVSFINYFVRKRAKRLARHLPNGAKIMDVGCGNGRFLEHLSAINRQFQLNGIEVHTKAALRATRRLKAKAWIHTITDLKKYFGKHAFDGVSYIHVFEHVANPVEVLDQLADVVKPHGVVQIVIPNIASKQAAKYKHNWLHLDPPRHLHFYPPSLLIEEMQKRGFEVIERKYHDIEQNPFGAIQSQLNVWLKKRDVLFERLKGNKTYAPEYKKIHVFFMKLFWISMLPFLLLCDRILAFYKQTATVDFIFRKKASL
jgi:ubiquinone/menaquinone biosynthesis C-methylase UbiE